MMDNTRCTCQTVLDWCKGCQSSKGLIMRHILTDTELRKLDGCKVSMHFVLTGKFKGYFAIIPKPGTTVLGYTQRGILTECVTKISRNAQAKARVSKRSVHAWIVGVFHYNTESVTWLGYRMDGSHIFDSAYIELHYNPKRDTEFMRHNGGAVTRAASILFWHGRIYLKG